MFTAEAGSSYYVVLEPYDASSCGTASVVLSALVTSPPPSPVLSIPQGKAVEEPAVFLQYRLSDCIFQSQYVRTGCLSWNLVAFLDASILITTGSSKEKDAYPTCNSSHCHVESP